MRGHIIVDIQSYMTGIALVEGARLKEYYIEYKQADNLTGNIYKGRVVNVLKGLQSAFVNFGSVRNGFLAVHETLAHRTMMGDSGVMPHEIAAREGEMIMVQTTKEEIGTKGARLTTNITLPGRYVVFLPNLDFVGVSAKITDDTVREKLTRLLTRAKPKGGGFIGRTACLEAKHSEILSEIRQLAGVWEQIKRNYEHTTGVGQVYSAGDCVFRTVRDMLGPEVEAVTVNDTAAAEQLYRQLKDHRSRYADRVRLYDGETDILERFGILSEIEKLINRRVVLASGVSLVIDHTEALTVIDVNTARFNEGENHEETVFGANLEAAVEIARQIRLRNIGGIIIVDFIDMSDELHKQAVLDALHREMVFDRTKTRIAGMTSLGLVEITRKKIGRELSTLLLDKCPYCEGDALSSSTRFLARKLTCGLRGLFASGYTTALVTANETLIDELLLGGYYSTMMRGEWADKRIYLIPDRMLAREQYRLGGSQEAVVSVPAAAKMLY